MRVHEVMTRKVITVHPETPLKDVAKKKNKHRIS